MPNWKSVIVTLLVLASFLSLPNSSDAFAWRLFAGREECLSEFLPERQWAHIKKSSQHPEQTKMFVDLAFVVTTKYGGQEEQAAVDFSVISPTGGIIKAGHGVSEEEFEEVVTGGQGPWKVCFRVSSGALLKPSVFVKIAYFNVYSDEESMAGFDWQESEPNVPDPQHLGTKEQIMHLEHALLRLDHYLLNVTHEQRYLYARTVRHLHTAQSTLSRTFWYYLAIYTTICFASFSQLVAVRLMFKKSRKQGLII